MIPWYGTLLVSVAFVACNLVSVLVGFAIAERSSVQKKNPGDINVSGSTNKTRYEGGFGG
jgi:hypothetical protein